MKHRWRYHTEELGNAIYICLSNHSVFQPICADQLHYMISEFTKIFESSGKRLVFLVRVRRLFKTQTFELLFKEHTEALRWPESRYKMLFK